MPSPPRPILKIPPSPTLTATCPLPFPSSRIPVFDSPHVHFPPTPTLTQTEITHSSFTYDRKPIVVLPNACALPGRGERAMDSFVEAECDLEVWAPGGFRKKRIPKGGYFHPRAYEAVEYEAGEGDQPDPSPSSLLFARDSSYLSSSYRFQIDDGHACTLSHFRPIPTIGTLDASDTACDPSKPGNLHRNGAMDPCQFIQHIPHLDLSLPFIPQKQTHVRNKTQALKEKECPSSPKKRSSNNRSRTIGTGTNSFERTRKVVSKTGYGNLNSGFCDPGLEGCLGGF